MASKLRRTPLLSYEGMCSYGPFSSQKQPGRPGSSGLTVTTTTTTTTPPSAAATASTTHSTGVAPPHSYSRNQHARSSTNKMECGIAGYANGNAATSPPGGGNSGGGVRGAERSPAKAGLHVAFQEKGEVKERREKFLTAKYGSHQMSLIRKRLAVEMWLYEEVKKLYESTAKHVEDDEVEIDIDQLLDMENDDERRRHLQSQLTGAKKSQTDVKKFINDLLDKAKTL